MNRITPVAISLAIALPVLAQEPPAPPGSGWSDAVRAIIFADPANGTLRAPEEIAARWAQLTPEDRALVRADCDASKNVADEEESSEAAALPGSTGAEDNEPSDNRKNPDATIGAAVSLSHLVQVCRVVDGL